MNKIILTLILVLLSCQQGFSQRSSSRNINTELIGYQVKDFVQLTIQTGFMNPVNPYFRDGHYASGIMGADLSYRVNTEVALYTELKYNFLSAKDTAAPHSGYFETTIGARYYIRPSCCRSSIFFEVGFGPYIYFQGATADENNKLMKTSQTNVRMGGNAGVGAELVLTNSLFLTLKSKMNSVFEPNGCTSYITGVGGFSIRF